MRPDGTFVIRNLAPGEYIVRAEPQFRQGVLPDLANAIVTIAGRNIDGLNLVATPPSTVSGRIVIDPGAADPLKTSSLTLSATLMDQEPGYFVDASGRVKDDLTFEIKAAPGRNTIGLMNLPNGVAMRAIRYGGADVSDSGFNVKPNEDVSGIELELTNHPTIVSGQVSDARGAPVKDGTVASPLATSRWISPVAASGRPADSTGNSRSATCRLRLFCGGLRDYPDARCRVRSGIEAAARAGDNAVVERRRDEGAAAQHNRRALMSGRRLRGDAVGGAGRRRRSPTAPVREGGQLARDALSVRHRRDPRPGCRRRD